MKNKIKWAAELSHVREVSLLGMADAGLWTERLRQDDLIPEQRDGRAQVMIVAADAKFMGLGFRELSVSILARQASAGDSGGGGGGEGGGGAWLAHAWNSRRFFAFCERTFFA